MAKRRKKKQVVLKLPVDLVAEAQAGEGTFAGLVDEALEQAVLRLESEHNDGKPFPARKEQERHKGKRKPVCMKLDADVQDRAKNALFHLGRGLSFTGLIEQALADGLKVRKRRSRGERPKKKRRRRGKR